MAVSNYQTLGQAWAAMQAYVIGTAFGVPTLIAGCSWTWTPAVTGVQGFFKFVSTTPAVTQQFNVLESSAHPNMPLAYVLNQPEFSTPKIVNAAEQSGANMTLGNAISNGCAALRSAINDLCGTSTSASNTQAIYLGSNSGVQVSLLWNSLSFSTGWTCGQVMINLYNHHYDNATYVMDTTNYLHVSTPQIQNITVNPSAAVNVNVGPPLDVDLSVNALQSTFSTISKTTTIT